MKRCIFAILSLVASVAMASTYTGVPVYVVTGASPDGSNTTRMSIYTGTATACSASGWYAFEYAANGVGPGPAWFAQALDAKLLLSSITISGSGACDAYGVETIHAIQNN